jgi:hypothetical protein
MTIHSDAGLGTSLRVEMPLQPEPIGEQHAYSLS